MCERWGGSLNIDCLSEEGGSDRAGLIRGWIQQTAEDRKVLMNKDAEDLILAL